MKVFLDSNNPAVISIVTISCEKAGADLISEDSGYDLLIKDLNSGDEMGEVRADKTLFLLPKDSEVVAKFSLTKPFLPTDLIKALKEFKPSDESFDDFAPISLSDESEISKIVGLVNEIDEMDAKSSSDELELNDLIDDDIPLSDIALSLENEDDKSNDDGKKFETKDKETDENLSQDESFLKSIDDDISLEDLALNADDLDDISLEDLALSFEGEASSKDEISDLNDDLADIDLDDLSDDISLEDLALSFDESQKEDIEAEKSEAETEKEAELKVEKSEDKILSDEEKDELKPVEVLSYEAPKESESSKETISKTEFEISKEDENLKDSDEKKDKEIEDLELSDDLEKLIEDVIEKALREHYKLKDALRDLELDIKISFRDK